ncbi:MAG: hypothetical protein WCF30_10820 [Terracidiphilus sp.]
MECVASVLFLALNVCRGPCRAADAARGIAEALLELLVERGNVGLCLPERVVTGLTIIWSPNKYSFLLVYASSSSGQS